MKKIIVLRLLVLVGFIFSVSPLNARGENNQTVFWSSVSEDGSSTYTLTVTSSPHSNVYIAISPYDKDMYGGGYTTFNRTYDPGTDVTLLALSTSSGMHFSKWTVAGTDYSSNQITVTMDEDKTATAVYSTSPPEISLNRTEIYFAYVLGGKTPRSQTFKISNSGSGTLNWSIADGSDVHCFPDSGSGDAIITISVDPSGLSIGNYFASLEISDSSASNSPQTLHVYLEVKTPSSDAFPFGDFSSPSNGSTVRGSIPVTGWAIDDTDLESVKIYRGDGKSLTYIGDAVFVEGARPDVQAVYPTYPASYKAGWGYMLLTPYLPNGGNGTYTLHAIAIDTGGHQTTLGTKTISCDNANAVKPFGAIDTPAQSGTASGSSFVNWGWVLTPQPDSIPTDGSTINVWVNSVNLGHPNYNIYREDIAALLPGYANTNGALGYFILDTTRYAAGIHTIQWTAIDSGGHSDGIGSRFFSIDNSGTFRSDNNNNGSILKPKTGDNVTSHPITRRNNSRLITNPSNFKTTAINRIQTRELERIRIDLFQFLQENALYRTNNRALRVTNRHSLEGYLLVDGKLKSLPIGSFLDKQKAVFSWIPAHGFIGHYHLVFADRSANGTIKRKDFMVEIIPRY